MRQGSTSSLRACQPGSVGWAMARDTPCRTPLQRTLVRTGKVSAPIVIGRDHLDSGSVVSPYRETEAMLDGSDAIADWPLLNALTATSRCDLGVYPSRRWRGLGDPFMPAKLVSPMAPISPHKSSNGH
ncbi:MAG: hypothetical protein R2709_00095 [Marmoricola sp.]